VLPPVFLLGVFSHLRLVQTSIEDMVYAVGSFRIRQYFSSPRGACERAAGEQAGVRHVGLVP
jgi:hypothetical protein